ncbi:MAG: hypothetical protein AAF517_07935, partial [Planctomycetota bacterium]
ITGVSDSDLDDDLETGNSPDSPVDDDVTRITIGGVPGAGTLAGVVFLDTDHNDSPGQGEPKEQSWVVELVQGDSVVATTQSGADGSYFFTGVQPGEGYSIRFRHPDTGVVFGIEEGVDVVAGSNQADLDLPIDPSGVIYDAATRLPVTGARVRIGGPPGFNPFTHLLPGQNGQETAVDGMYRFDLLEGAPAGLYEIVVDPPLASGLGFPSELLTPQPTSLNLRDEVIFITQSNDPPPVGVNTATYYLSFRMEPGDGGVANNHIPLDQLAARQGQLHVTKRSPLNQVRRGGLVPYVVEITNLEDFPLEEILLSDKMPPGFKYVDGSATLDGEEVEADADSSGTVEIEDVDFEPNETRELRMILVVGTGVSEGRYINQAWAGHRQFPDIASNVAEAVVEVVPDPTFDATDIIGKVFDDKNENGVQDDGEQGIPGVRIATVRGLLVTTDRYGRYHIAQAAIPHASRGSNFILKLDESTLPPGYKPTTENPRVIRVTRGKFSKLNFGVAKPAAEDELLVLPILDVDVSKWSYLLHEFDRAPKSRREWDSWLEVCDQAVEQLLKEPAVLRVNYYKKDEDLETIHRRIDRVALEVRRRWDLNRYGRPLEVKRRILNLHFEPRDAPVQFITGHWGTPTRVVELELTDYAFDAVDPVLDESGRRKLWFRLGVKAIRLLQESPALLRILYTARREDDGVAARRIEVVEKPLRRLGGDAGSPYPLSIDSDVVRTETDLRTTTGQSVEGAPPDPVRVVRLDLSRASFGDETDKDKKWHDLCSQAVESLLEAEAELRVTYVADGEPKETTDSRLRTAVEEIERLWSRQARAYPLTIRERVARDSVELRDGRPPYLRDSPRTDEEPLRVVRIDLKGRDFEEERAAERALWFDTVRSAVERLREENAILWVTYFAEAESPERIAERMRSTTEEVSRLWTEHGEPYPLTVRERVIRGGKERLDRELPLKLVTEAGLEEWQLDLSSSNFVSPDESDQPLWFEICDETIRQLRCHDCKLLVVYHAYREPNVIVRDRAAAVITELQDRWRTDRRKGELSVRWNEIRERRPNAENSLELEASQRFSKPGLYRKSEFPGGIQTDRDRHDLSDVEVGEAGDGGPTGAAPFQGLRHDLSDVLVKPPMRFALPKHPAVELGAGAVRRDGPLKKIIDGETVYESELLTSRYTTEEAAALAQTQVEIGFDEFEVKRVLSVHAEPRTATRDRDVQFRVYSNYNAWIDRRELRIFKKGRSVLGEPLEILPISDDERVAWVPGDDAGEGVLCVLRVYDASGNFDETRPLELPVSPIDFESEVKEEDEESVLLGAYGENQIEVSNIPLRGGTVTANGRKVPEGFRVTFMGRDVPVAKNGDFAAQEIVSPGAHVADVTIFPPDGRGLLYRRNLYVADSKWFYVGLADLTVGGHSADETAKLVTGDEEFDKEIYVNGRAALYLKGKIRGDYILTASLDTQDGSIEDIFSNLNEKDPRSLLRRLDPDLHYPVYGDDSTIRQDAPTQGKLYVRLERGESYVLWGNFASGITGTELAQVDRGLYGARVHWVTEDSTTYGEKRTQVDAFVASPDTIGVREEFRGTGGSLYYLRRIDVVMGSERLRVEIRDRDSGLVLETKELRPQEDYDIDYLQGRILMRRPLQSTVDDGFTVDSGSLSGHEAFLVVRYEYIPSSTDFDDFAAGGRASHWVNDHLQIGVTGSSQESLSGDQDLAGVDMTLRLTPETYIKAEVASTEGPGFGEARSLTGGFSFTDLPQDRAVITSALGFRIEGASAFKDFVDWDGLMTAYYEEREAGFAAPGKIARNDTTLWGTKIEAPIYEDTLLRFKYDEYEETEALAKRAVSFDVHHDLPWDMYTDVGIRHDRVEASVTGRSGQRSDLALRVGYKSPADWETYTFVQGTISRSENRSANNRYGIGGEF